MTVRPSARFPAMLTAASVLVAGCSDPTDAPSEPVAAVVISNVPAGPALVGTTIQLAATALNATGGIIDGAGFTWRTSDPNVAGVSGGGLVSALRAGAVTITATSGGTDGTAVLDLRAGATVGPEGGVISLPDGKLILNIPVNGLGQTIDFLIRPVPDPANHPQLVPGTVFEIGPAGLHFSRATTLTLRFDPTDLPSGTPAEALQVYMLVGNVWRLVPASTVSTADRTVTGTVFGTGTFAAVGTAVHHIELTGAAGEALYTGQTANITATPFDLDGNPLVRTITWSSSDPAIATVSADGLVTGHGPGSATITAESGGKTASTTLLVLARPVADWSRATEWTTFQGDAGHTGFVAATLDPVAFAPRWSRDLSQGSALNPVTFGPDAVFVSTEAYFGTQMAFGLSLQTGSTRWSVDFGAIHGVHPPAYGNGTVYLTTSGHQDSYLYALDPATGAQRFRSAYGNQWSTYYAPVVANQRVHMAGGYYGGMYAFDAATGAQLWFDVTNGYDAWTPAVRNGVVYAYTGEYSPEVVAVSASDGSTLFEIADPNFDWRGWSMNTAPVLGTENDLLAIQSDRLISFDLQSKTIRWEIAANCTGAVTTSAGVIYVVNGGQLEARDESDGTQLWAWKPVDANITGTTIVTENLVFVSTATHTYAIDLAVHRRVWSYPFGGRLALSAQGALLIAGQEGRLDAIAVR